MNELSKVAVTRCHPSTSTNSSNLNGKLIITGGSNCIPMLMSTDEITKSNELLKKLERFWAGLANYAA